MCLYHYVTFKGIIDIARYRPAIISRRGKRHAPRPHSRRREGK